MAVYKRGNVWWYQFYFAGRKIQESAKTPRKTVAKAAEDRRRAELERALAGLPVESTETRINRVSDSVATYLKHYPSNHRAQSVRFAKQRLVHVERLLGSLLVIDLTEDRIRDYIATRLKEKAGGRTVNMELGELSRALGNKWSVLWPRVRKLEENHDIGRALSPEEEQSLLKAASSGVTSVRNPGLYAFIKIALTTGMRSGEIAGLTWGQIDFGAGIITVGKAKTRGGTGRQIPMNADVRGALEIHAAWYANPKRFGEIRPEWHLFPTRSTQPNEKQARPLDPMRPVLSIKTAWGELRKAAGVQCRLHDLRHTAATKMAEAGVPESTMLAIMGHMSRAMLERYSHVRMAAKRTAVESLALTTTVATVEESSEPVATKSPTVADSAMIN